MEFDLDNPVVKLCTDGMNSEAQGRIEEARQFFKQAWESSSNDFEKFTAAHYLARNQSDPNDELKWNLEALARGITLPGDNIKSHFPSLYLNVGKSYETLGNKNEAKENYQLALKYSSYLPRNAYGDLIRSGIKAGLQRSGSSNFENRVLDELVYKWCEQKELRPLSLVLPAYLGNLGDDDGTNKLVSALSFLSSTRCLNQEDQGKINTLIAEMLSVD